MAATGAKAAARLLRRADILSERRRFAEALQACREALAADGGNAGIYRRIGGLSVVLDEPQAAVDALQIALELDPHDASALVNLGAALRALGQPAEAVRRLQQGLQIVQSPSAWFNLGIAYADVSRWEDAVACQRRVLQVAPGHVKASAALAIALLALGAASDAVAVVEGALATAPQAPRLHTILAQALLMRGDLARGWREFEWRWAVPENAGNRRHADLSPWLGEPIAGRRLLIHAEQGLGDTLQMCRYVPFIEGAGAVVLEVQPGLVRLLETLAAPAGTALQVVPRGAPLPPLDLQCPMMSLPLACASRVPDDIPREVPYLHAAGADVARWAALLPAGPGLKVGLCWSSGVRPDLVSRIIHARKSIPLELLAPLDTVAGCRFVSLQKGEVAADLPIALPGLDILDHSGLMTDFAQTAAAIRNLDLVITVDTAVAHLAGALGHPVWLLNRADADWRWSAAHRDAPWYPTLREFRQPVPGDWTSVVQRVARALAEL
ncbi:tetratricopeptide repeat protein [Lichenicoccus roseus]|uniref:Tetratricopeptide repeat protein n=1 Tax=Lichenicoccus roseus TaxID=2683649 RepID=A0A5R9J9U0_9PROT|nr:tetratricopeptide repeat protein [Lichenicoccus roseus]TLU72126.1 tetratricopeptide repeat protein [Lichenicoccus roseus]